MWVGRSGAGIGGPATVRRGRTPAKVTPIKGGAYQDGINAVMQDVAAGLGDAYDDTGTVVGVLPRSKKGDGVLAVGGTSGWSSR